MVSQMMGMTGIGFHFIVHEECCPSSVTVRLTSEHQQAMARIGFRRSTWPNPAHLSTMQPAGTRFSESESVDRDRTILWGVDTGEFAVYGYDDDDQVLLVSGSLGGQRQRLTQGPNRIAGAAIELVTAPALRHLDISPLGLFGACSRRQCLTLASTRWQSTTSWPALP